jgi:hypothetical protein
MAAQNISKQHGKKRNVSKNTITKNRSREGLPSNRTKKLIAAQAAVMEAIAKTKVKETEKVAEEKVPEETLKSENA